MAKERKGILILNNWFDLMIDILTPEQTIELLKMIRAKSKGETYSNSDVVLATHWFHMENNIEASIEKYAELCAKRSQNGKQGGAPKGNKNASKNKQNNQNQANDKKQAMDKEKDKDTYTSYNTSTSHLNDASYEDLFNN
jgi:hypothetical protein